MATAIEKKDAAALRKIYAKGFAHTHGSGPGRRQGGAHRRGRWPAIPMIETAPVTDL